jgi:YidC/Oxa1 family membrane protein insertase
LAEIKNPNQQGGGGQDSRTILAFSSIFLLMFLGLQYFKQKKGPEPPPQQQQQQAALPTPLATPPVAGVSAGSPGQLAASVKADTESETIVENELYRIGFSNRGGQVTSWILKKYTDEGGKPLDMVNHEAAPQHGYPLSLYTYDPGLTKQLSQALYQPSATGTLATPGKLSFTFAEGGLSVTKTFSFDSSYVVTADILVTNNGVPVNAMLSWPSGLGDQETLQSYNTNSQFDTSLNGKSDYESPKKVVGGATLTGNYDYVGISDLYFAAIFLPDVPARANVVGLHGKISIPRNRKTPDPNVTDQASVLGAAVGDSSGHTRLRLFAGPKVIQVLASVRATAPDGSLTGPSLEPIINFGWLKIIAKPFFLALRWIHQHIVPNWGWAILVLTLFINLAMLPTRVQMMKSALKMQRIQPEMDAIKNRYKNYKMNDPRKQEMNKEIFDLQKREGVNMFGGCLPMLVQMPLLFGFYKMLSNVIELRHADWLWLHDLAAPDPLHILPVFFIVTMFLVQFLTPSPGVDPAQQKMMAFTMPVFFGFMTWNLASGLALYWSFGNIINVVQQIIMNRTKMGKEMKDIAARRNAKRLLKGTARR